MTWMILTINMKLYTITRITNVCTSIPIKSYHVILSGEWPSSASDQGLERPLPRDGRQTVPSSFPQGESVFQGVCRPGTSIR